MKMDAGEIAQTIRATAQAIRDGSGPAFDRDIAARTLVTGFNMLARAFDARQKAATEMATADPGKVAGKPSDKCPTPGAYFLVSGDSYVSFMTGSQKQQFRPFWHLVASPVVAARFKTRAEAERCIEQWSRSDNPLPENVRVIE